MSKLFNRLYQYIFFPKIKKDNILCCNYVIDKELYINPKAIEPEIVVNTGVDRKNFRLVTPTSSTDQIIEYVDTLEKENEIVMKFRNYINITRCKTDNFMEIIKDHINVFVEEFYQCEISLIVSDLVKKIKKDEVLLNKEFIISSLNTIYHNNDRHYMFSLISFSKKDDNINIKLYGVNFL